MQTILDALKTKQLGYLNEAALQLYIPPQLKQAKQDAQVFAAEDIVVEWLYKKESRCLLLLGDSGAGKTLLSHWLIRRLWQQYQPGGIIPLLMPLLVQSDLKKPDLLERYLAKTFSLSDEAVNWLKSQPLLLIVDGYDEVYERINLYQRQAWHRFNLKVLISCRSQALANLGDYRKLFVPYDNKDCARYDAFEEWTITPFTQADIQAYLKRYVESQAATAEKTQVSSNAPSNDWGDWQTYWQQLERLPNLQNLVVSPFALSMIVQVLPEALAEHEQASSVEQRQWVRISVYERFVQHYFARQAKKLREGGHIDDSCPIEEAFMLYCQKLAYAMLQARVTSVHYKPQTHITLFQSAASAEKNPWAMFFEAGGLSKVGDSEIKLSMIRAGCPLITLEEGYYAFLHKSLLDFFAAKQLFQGAMIRASIALGCELNEKLLLDEPDKLLFFAEKVQQDPVLKSRLFEVIDESRHEERVQVAAANAITILNYAKCPLSNLDLQRIRIRGADLSHAVLHNSHFQQADLREVNFRSAYLSQVNFSGALLDNAQFGELPYLDFKHVIESHAYSTDSQWLAIGDWSGYIYLYTAHSEKLSKTFKNWSGLTLDKNPVLCLCFSPDNRYLAAGSKDASIRLWDVKTGLCLHTLLGHKQAVQSLSFGAVGNRLLSGGADGSVKLWDVKKGHCLYSFDASTQPVYSVALSADGQYLASGGADKTLKIWRASDHPLCYSFNEHSAPITDICFRPQQKQIASASQDGAIKLWNIDNGQCVHTFKEHSADVYSLTFSADGNLLASGSQDKTVKLWDLLTYQCLCTYTGHTEGIRSVCFIEQDSRLASRSTDGTIRRWKIETGQALIADTLQRSMIFHIALCPKPSRLVSADKNGNLILWNTVDGQPLLQINAHKEPIYSVAYSPDGNSVAVASQDKTITLWDGAVGSCLRTFKGHEESVRSIAWNPCKPLLASGSNDKSIKLWNLDTGALLSTLSGHKGGIASIAFSPDGKTLASASQDETIKLWDLTKQQSMQTLIGHTDALTHVVFSPDGLQLASASQDKTLMLWQIKNGQCVRIFTGHTDTINCVAWSPDGQYLISGSGDTWGKDKTLRIWHTVSGRCLVKLSLLSPIQSIIWQSGHEGIAVSFGKDLAYYHVKQSQEKIQLVLQWSTVTWLDSDGMTLNQAAGLDESSYTLLLQQGASGKLSAKTSEAILKSRRQTILYDPKKPPRTVFTNQFFITDSQCAISLVCKKGTKHAFLLLESIENQQYLLRRIDFFIDQTQKTSSLLLGHIKRGEGLIIQQEKSLLSLGFYGEEPSEEQQFLHAHGYEINKACIQLHEKALSDIKQLISKKYNYKTWRISAEQGKQLLHNIETDQKQSIAYLETGNSKLYSGLDPGKEKHNCLTWCKKQLSLINIDISADESWLNSLADVLVAEPSLHIPEAVTSDKSYLETHRPCLIM